MQTAIDQFQENIKRVRELGAIYKILKNQTTEALDLSDILRAELVMSVSAFDHYIHRVVRLGMLESYHGKRPQTSAFLKFQVSLESALQGISAPMSDDWLEKEILGHHGWQSFQRSENVAQALKLISQKKIWQEIAIQIGKPAEDINSPYAVDNLTKSPRWLRICNP